MNRVKYLFLNLPDPPGKTIYRGYGGGYGVAGPPSDETLLPIYLLYAASAARNAGAAYRVIDAQAMRYSPSRVRELVRDISPDVVVSLASLPSFREDLALLGEIKRDNPAVSVAVLGPAAGALPEEALSLSGADVILTGAYPYYNLIAELLRVSRPGPGERYLVRKIRGAVFMENKKIIRTEAPAPRENLEDVSFDVYAELPARRYLLNIPDINWRNVPCFPIVTSTGCPFG